MRIVIGTAQSGWHGGEEQARLLAEGLRARGHDVLVAARRDGVFAQRLSEWGLEGFTFPGRGRTPTALWKIRRRLRAFAPRVLYSNDPHFLTCGNLAAWGLGIPCRVAARRVDFALRSPWRYRHWCHRLICVSRAVAEICQRCGVPANQLSVVHDGVDPQRVLAGDRARGRTSLALDCRTPLLICVATLTDHKGHRYLLESLPAVLARFPDLVLALAGDGELAAELADQARRLGIADHVRWLGYRSDVPDLIRAADLFVLASHLEGLCSSLIDAMLAGVPIVSTRAGGIPDLLDAADGSPPVAWLVPPRDPAGLAAALCQALESPAERAARAERARERAERLFTADCMVERTLDVFRSVLDGPGGVGNNVGPSHGTGFHSPGNPGQHVESALS